MDLNFFEKEKYYYLPIMTIVIIGLILIILNNIEKSFEIKMDGKNKILNNYNNIKKIEKIESLKDENNIILKDKNKLKDIMSSDILTNRKDKLYIINNIFSNSLETQTIISIDHIDGEYIITGNTFDNDTPVILQRRLSKELKNYNIFIEKINSINDYYEFIIKIKEID